MYLLTSLPLLNSSFIGGVRYLTCSKIFAAYLNAS